MGPAVSEHYGHLTQKMEPQTIGSDLFAPHADEASHEFLRNISDRRDGEVWGGTGGPNTSNNGQGQLSRSAGFYDLNVDNVAYAGTGLLLKDHPPAQEATQMICTRWQHGSTWPKIIPRAQTETAKSAAGVCFAIHPGNGTRDAQHSHKTWDKAMPMGEISGPQSAKIQGNSREPLTFSGTEDTPIPLHSYFFHQGEIRKVNS